MSREPITTHEQELVQKMPKRAAETYSADYNPTNPEGNPMETIQRVTTDKRRYMSLLLDADPSEAMLARYLDAGEMYILSKEGEALCEAVVLRLPFRQCELMNLATSPAHRRQGCASRLLAHLFQLYAQTCDLMWVGTAAAGVGFYKRYGFSVSHTLKHFFTRHYPEPIYDDGMLCDDMCCLIKTLRPA